MRWRGCCRLPGVEIHRCSRLVVVLVRVLRRRRLLLLPRLLCGRSGGVFVHPAGVGILGDSTGRQRIGFLLVDPAFPCVRSAERLLELVSILRPHVAGDGILVEHDFVVVFH